MARASIEQRLARLRSQADSVLARQKHSLPDALAIMQASGLTPDPWQTEILTRHALRILMSCCRQSGKSTVAAALALTEGLQQSSLVLLLSPSLRQSQELYRKVRDLYRPHESTVPIEQESALRLELVNGSRVVSLPGAEQKIRGFSGVRLLIVDEASRVPDALYYAIRPMLAVSGGRLVCLSTPFGQRGFFHHEWSEGEGWEKFKIVATDCPRISAEFLAEERASLGEWWFKQEYLHAFVETLDQVFSYVAVMGALSAEVQP